MTTRTHSSHRKSRAFAVAALIALASPVFAQTQQQWVRGELEAAPGLEWSQLTDALLLRDYNTRIVVVGTTILGLAAGVVGTFAYLRKRALMGDALSHATLPGIAAVFLLTGSKQLGSLATGAAISGVLGVLTVIGIRRFTRVKEDAAIGIVLSVMFAAGMALMSVVQQMGTGNEAGIANFLLGRAAAMTRHDATWIAVIAATVVLMTALLYKELALVCFDEHFAAAQGFSIPVVDVLMMSLVVLTTVIGLQAVGLILIVALLIIPATAARFWTDRLLTMTMLAGGFGAVSGWLGSTISALLPHMPTGAIIVLAAGVVFLISFLFAPTRGIVAEAVQRWVLRRRVGDQHLLRALAESEEQHGFDGAIPFTELLYKRGWSPVVLRRLAHRAARMGLIDVVGGRQVKLTEAGRSAAHRVLRNHRLWELYLIRHADIAPSHVDRDADQIEHVLSTDIIRELQFELDATNEIPPSPHLDGTNR